MSVNPFNVTIFDRDDRELQEFFIFAVCVAGKSATPTARSVAALLAALDHGEGELNPLSLIRRVEKGALAPMLKSVGIGCYNQRANTLSQAAAIYSRDHQFLRTWQVQTFEGLFGIGPKTARFFVLHSRPNQRLGCIDVHALRHLKKHGFKVPKKVPGRGMAYARLEEAYLMLADAARMSPAEYDLAVWTDAASPRKGAS